MSTKDEGHSLVMPFVVCRSEGGPYDDAAFVAGVRFAHVQAALADAPPIYETQQSPTLVPQLDLLAMERGYHMTIEHHSDEWALVTFRLNNPEGD